MDLLTARVGWLEAELKKHSARAEEWQQAAASWERQFHERGGSHELAVSTLEFESQAAIAAVQGQCITALRELEAEHQASHEELKQQHALAMEEEAEKR